MSLQLILCFPCPNRKSNISDALSITESSLQLEGRFEVSGRNDNSTLLCNFRNANSGGYTNETVVVAHVTAVQSCVLPPLRHRFHVIQPPVCPRVRLLSSGDCAPFALLPAHWFPIDTFIFPPSTALVIDMNPLLMSLCKSMDAFPRQYVQLQ
jgi:hypothetical protein